MFIDVSRKIFSPNFELVRFERIGAQIDQYLLYVVSTFFTYIYLVGLSAPSKTLIYFMSGSWINWCYPLAE